MNTQKAWRSVLTAVLATSLLTSCATLTRKSKQRIPVTSSPPGAIVSVNGERRGVTPLDLRLPRSVKSQVVRIESPGYNPFEIRMRRGFAYGYALADGLAGLLAGYVIAVKIHYAHDETARFGNVALICIPSALGVLFLGDLVSSAAYQFKPADLLITLSKADGTPRVDSVVIDADDLKNIRWIRVRKD